MQEKQKTLLKKLLQRKQLLRQSQFLQVQLSRSAEAM